MCVGPKKALGSLTMTLDALLANMEELCRLKDTILKDPDPIRQSSMRSTRSSSSASASSSSISETDRLEAHSLKYLPLVTVPMKVGRTALKRAHPDHPAMEGVENRDSEKVTNLIIIRDMKIVMMVIFVRPH